MESMLNGIRNYVFYISSSYNSIFPMFGNLCMCSMRDRCAIFLLSALCCGTVNGSEKQFAEAQDSTSNNATLPLVVGTWAHPDFQAAVQTGTHSNLSQIILSRPSVLERPENCIYVGVGWGSVL